MISYFVFAILLFLFPPFFLVAFIVLVANMNFALALFATKVQF